MHHAAFNGSAEIVWQGFGLSGSRHGQPLLIPGPVLFWPGANGYGHAQSAY